jgi:hypothetical protein
MKKNRMKSDPNTEPRTAPITVRLCVAVLEPEEGTETDEEDGKDGMEDPMLDNAMEVPVLDGPMEEGIADEVGGIAEVVKLVANEVDGSGGGEDKPP